MPKTFSLLPESQRGINHDFCSQKNRGDIVLCQRFQHEKFSLLRVTRHLGSNSVYVEEPVCHFTPGRYCYTRAKSCVRNKFIWLRRKKILGNITHPQNPFWWQQQCGVSLLSTNSLPLSMTTGPTCYAPLGTKSGERLLYFTPGGKNLIV